MNKKAAIARQIISKENDIWRKFLHHQQTNLQNKSHGCIPDQGRIEDMDGLVKIWRQFEKDIVKMKKQWDEFVATNNLADFEMTQSLRNKIWKMYDEWMKDYGIGMISISGDRYKSWENAKSLLEVDFRPYRKIWVLSDFLEQNPGGLDTPLEQPDSKRAQRATQMEPETAASRLASNRRKLTLPEFRELSERLWKTVNCMCSVGGKVPPPDEHERLFQEMSLIGYGTYLQNLHADVAVVGSNNIAQKPPRPSPNNWYGSLIYRPRDDPPPDKGPIIVWEPEGHEDMKQIFNIDTIPQGWVYMFGPEFKHAGGVNMHPHVRLHIHLDSKNPLFIRAPDRVFQEDTDWSKLDAKTWKRHQDDMFKKTIDVERKDNLLKISDRRLDKPFDP